MSLRNVCLAVSITIGFFAPLNAQDASTTPATSVYQNWLKEDVHWIISPEEQREFRNLITDDQRDKFVSDFWEKRNPHPGKENAFKEEHYRRLAFANENFAAGIEGSLTDRGRVYVVYGPPDSISKHSRSSGPPGETWFYHHLEGVGDDISVTFVDECACGAYELKKAPPAMF